jgi:hypothetical protein
MLNESVCRLCRRFSEKLMLKLQARYANRVDWGYLPTLEAYRHKLEVLRGYCEEVGRKFGEIQKSAWLGGQVFIEKSQSELDRQIPRWKPRDLAVEDFKKASFLCTPVEMVEKARQYLDLGVSNFMVFLAICPAPTVCECLQRTL